jgi:hypothetical protein
LKDPEEFLSTVSNGLLVYQSLFYQASVNSEKIQSALILDASLPESLIALRLLTKIARIIVVTVDQFDMQKTLQEEFPQAQIVFMHSQKNIDKAWAVTCGLGFDLICDYGGWMDTSRRSIIKMLGVFGRIITTSRQLQIDQPESNILSTLNA